MTFIRDYIVRELLNASNMRLFMLKIKLKHHDTLLTSLWVIPFIIKAVMPFTKITQK